MDGPLKIAVDFDGTIVEHKYPEIGKEVMFAFQTLRTLQEQGHQLILWTYRSGKELDDAVQYCRRNGIEFLAPQEIPEWTEVTVDLRSPVDGKPVRGTGVVVDCTGNRHAGYIVSLVFMSLSRQSQERLSELAELQPD